MVSCPVVIRCLAMRMRQSIAELEDAFVEEIEDDRERREHLRARRPALRVSGASSAPSKRGSLRFVLLVLTLIATAILVTIAMFETLYYVMG